MTISTSVNLRIRSFQTGYIPSETRTESYIYTSHMPTLPTASITVAYEDFFDYQTGIYVEGPNAEADDPHYGANYWEDWEKPVHLDFFNIDGELVVSQDLGCKIGGNWSRAQPQKTLKLYARDKYGKDEIEYPFFEDKPISSFHMILLRNSGNDFNNTQMRDGLISELAKEMNIDRQAYQPAVVYINGEYYGIQNVREKQNKHYIAENYGYDKEDIDVIKNGGWGDDELIDGQKEDFWEMRNYLENTDLSIDENYKKAQNYLDISNFIDYNVLEMYVVNEDWPGNNIAYWHNRKLQTPWRYLLFDADFGFGIWNLEEKVNKNMLTWCTSVDSENYATANWATIILRQLLQNKDFTRDFLNATADRLNTTLSPNNVDYMIDSIYNLISDEMYYHKERWGENWQDGWLSQMREFGQRRATIMRRQTEDYFNTNGSYTLSINISEEKAGTIHLNTIDVNKFPWSAKYFKNNTIFLTAIPNPGYEFVRWEGSIISSEKSIEITTDQATNITAVFNYVGNEPNITISEIYYHIFEDGETKWIELYNEGSDDIDLSNWTITLDRYNQQFTIPQKTILSSKDYIVCANDTSLMRNNYPNIAIIGNMGIDFPKDFATITIRDNNGCKVAETRYREDESHAQKADGYGFSCELIDGDWFAPTKNGTPGKENTEKKVIPTWNNKCIISEINYASGKNSDAGDWIEIYLPKDATFKNLKSYMIQDKSGNISVIYDDIYIAPGEYIVFADNPEKFHNIFPSVQCYQLDLGLNNYVESIGLYDNYEYEEDYVSYSMFDNSWTKLAFETGKTLSLTDVQADNSKGTNWQASLNLGSPGRENDFTTGIYNFAQIEVQVYPNPCNDYIISNIINDFSYRIIASNGQIVTQGNSTTDKTISTQSLQPGTYLFVAKQGEKQYISVFTKE